MPIFYTIHNFGWGKDLTDGQRNCRTFIYGACVYIVLYIILKNMQINCGMDKRFDTLFMGLFFLIIADICVMAYTYRSYYGRTITNECILTNEDTSKWKYDKDNHKYIDVPIEEKLNKELQEIQATETFKIKRENFEEQINDLKKKLLIEKKTKEKNDKIIDKKLRIRAAKTIQRWWRDKLYRPGDGIFYLRSQKHFDSIKT